MLDDQDDGKFCKASKRENMIPFSNERYALPAQNFPVANSALTILSGDAKAVAPLGAVRSIKLPFW